MVGEPPSQNPWVGRAESIQGMLRSRGPLHHCDPQGRLGSSAAGSGLILAGGQEHPKMAGDMAIPPHRADQ